jgi:predicted small lipoprotein YifL
MKNKMPCLVSLGLVLAAFAACGQKAEAPPSPAKTAAEAQAADDAGKAIVDEILAAFDQCAADAAALAKDKPEAAVLMPQLEKLYADYGVKMAALNARFLALRDQDVFAFRRANGYMSDNRPRHVFAKDNTLNAAYVYYNLEKGERAVVDMLSSGIVKLLDDAVRQ